MFLSNSSIPAPFRIMRARSCHIIDTHNHNVIPTIENPKSYICRPSMPLSDIAHNTKQLATHLTYQSRVCLGVADLKILLEFSSSSLVYFTIM